MIFSSTDFDYGRGFNEAAILPNTEGLQEVRVINNNFTAGVRRGQSVISLSTKSGRTIPMASCLPVRMSPERKYQFKQRQCLARSPSR